MRSLGRIVLLLPVAGACASANAGMLTWDFVGSGNANNDNNYSSGLLNTRTFTNQGVSITATGYQTNPLITTPINPSIGDLWNPASTKHQLFRKWNGAGDDETGLGLEKAYIGPTQGSGSANYDTDHEITAYSFIQLDVTNAKAHGAVDLSFVISSVQDGEGWAIWGSNSAGKMGKLIADGRSADVGYTVNSATFSAYKYFSLSALTRSDWHGYYQKSNNVLLQNGLHSRVLTPEPFTTSLGIAGIGLYIRRRRAAKKA